MNTILERINLAGAGFVDFAIPMLIQSGILIIILLIVDLLLRKKVRAVFRYWIWMLVLIKLILPTSLSSPVSIGSWLGNKIEVVEPIHNISTPKPKPPIVSAPPTTNLIDLSRVRPVIPPVTTQQQPVPTEIPETKQQIPQPTTPPIQLSWQGALFLVWLAVVMRLTLLSFGVRIEYLILIGGVVFDSVSHIVHHVDVHQLAVAHLRIV